MLQGNSSVQRSWEWNKYTAWQALQSQHRWSVWGKCSIQIHWCSSWFHNTSRQLHTCRAQRTTHFNWNLNMYHWNQQTRFLILWRYILGLIPTTQSQSVELTFLSSGSLLDGGKSSFCPVCPGCLCWRVSVQKQSSNYKTKKCKWTLKVRGGCHSSSCAKWPKTDHFSVLFLLSC